MSEIEQAIINEREQCALLLEQMADERRKWAVHASKERKGFFLETADLVMRLAQLVRERESVTV